MALTKEDFLTRLTAAVQDAAEDLEPDDLYRFLDQAILLFSKDRPNKKAAEITGDGSTYEWTLVSIAADWVEDFSFINGEIEYPADDYQYPQYVDRNSWMHIRKTDALYFRFTSFIPANGKKARFEYAVPHAVTDSANSVKDGDSEAVINLSAALCFWALAAKYAQSTDPTMDADVVDHQRKAELYTELAKEKSAMYNALLGITSDAKSRATALAGVAIKDMDIMYPGSLGDFLTHPASTR